MSARTKRSLVKYTAAVGVLSAAAVMASTIPASAAGQFTIYGASGAHQAVICTEGSSHGTEAIPDRGIVAADNSCGTRVWLFENSNGTGWGICVSPGEYINLPGGEQFPLDAWVSYNPAKC